MDQFSSGNPLAEKTNKPWWVRFAKVYTFVVFIGVFFILGLVVGGVMNQPQSSDDVIKYTANELENIFSNNDEVDVDLFTELWEYIHNDYLDKNSINDKDLFYGALTGMVDALGDPHSVFFNPKVTEEFSQELDGTFYGIGAEIGRRDGYIVVVAPLADTPASRAGLQPGDKILAIDDKDIIDMSVDEAVSLIRGDKGTEVVLMIVSEGDRSTKEVRIVRDKINVPSVQYNLEDNIAIIELSNFNDNTDSEFTKIAQQILNVDPAGVILDLRNNPGGFLDTAVEVASHWVEPGEVVVRESFSDKRNDNDYRARKTISLAKFKTIILVNEGSASASEIVAGALQDYNLAQIVGMTTFGKGSVQQLIPLKDDSSVKLTVARWLTPKGRTIEEQGIFPDYEVDYTLEDYDNNKDPQLDKAKELIFE